jgi:hypothetical protein
MANKDTLSKHKEFKAKLDGKEIPKSNAIFTPKNKVLTYDEILTDCILKYTKR